MTTSYPRHTVNPLTAVAGPGCLYCGEILGRRTSIVQLADTLNDICGDRAACDQRSFGNALAKADRTVRITLAVFKGDFDGAHRVLTKSLERALERNAGDTVVMEQTRGQYQLYLDVLDGYRRDAS